MSIRASRRPPFLVGLLGVAALTFLALSGCNRSDTDDKDPVPPPVAVEPKKDEPKQQVAAKPGETLGAEEYARLHQSFKDAVLLEPPAEGELLPDLTCTGKNVARLFEEIAGKDNEGGLWDQVRFADEKKRLQRFRAVLTTGAGEVHIDLFPEAAPNHVRSFIALTRAGYFDGMPIYRSVRILEGETVVAAYVESGCPTGEGKVGHGSIGYWLKPETRGNPLTHDEGAVGATHREEPETAACRFYITAEKMPQMDGEFTVFGKVTRGLDLVRTINTSPVSDTTSHRLKEPVLIQKAVIQVLDAN